MCVESVRGIPKSNGNRSVSLKQHIKYSLRPELVKAFILELNDERELCQVLLGIRDLSPVLCDVFMEKDQKLLVLNTKAHYALHFYVKGRYVLSCKSILVIINGDGVGETKHQEDRVANLPTAIIHRVAELFRNTFLRIFGAVR